MKHLLMLMIALSLASCVDNSVPRPKSDAEFTSQIGWWPYQKNLQIDAVSTKVVHSELNLFNSKSLMEFRIKGTMKSSNGWRPVIEEVHIAERIIKGGNFNDPVGEIRLEPIINVIKDKSYHGETITFDINQQAIISTMGWGKNTYKVICGNHNSELVVHHYK